MPARETSRIIAHKVLGFEQIELIGHAQRRMKQRVITLNDIIRTIDAPDRLVPSSNPRRIRARWIKSKFASIDVVYEELADRIRVITVIRK